MYLFINVTQYLLQNSNDPRANNQYRGLTWDLKSLWIQTKQVTTKFLQQSG